MMPRVKWIGAAGCALAVAGASADVVFRPLIVSGQTVPGPAGPLIVLPGTFNLVRSQTIDGQGRFLIDLLGECIYSGDIRSPDLDLQAVLCRNASGGGLPPDTSISSYTREFLRLADGRFVVGALLAGAGVSGQDGRVWLVQPVAGGPVAVLARVNHPAPGLPGVNFGFFEALEHIPGMNAAGSLAFSTDLAGAVTAADDSALWRAEIDNPAAATIIAREGAPVPGLGAGPTYGPFVHFIQPLVGPTGDVYALTRIIDPAASGGQYRAILRFAPGSDVPTVLLRTDQPLGPLASFDLADPLQLSPDGGTLVVPLSTGAVRALAAINLSGEPEVRLVAAPGMPAPDASTTVTTVGFGPVVGADQKTAFSAGLADGPGTQALFSETSTGLTMLLRSATATPLLPDGVTFSSFDPIGRTPRGDVLFTSFLTGAGVGSSNNQVLGVVRPDGQAEILLRKGDQATALPGPPGIVRGFAADSFGQMQPVTAAREFLVSVTLTDNSRALYVAAIDPCAADFNHDGEGSLQDLFDFLGALFTQAPAADVNGVGGVSVQDLFDFLSAWLAGCA